MWRSSPRGSHRIRTCACVGIAGDTLRNPHLAASKHKAGDQIIEFKHAAFLFGVIRGACLRRKTTLVEGPRLAEKCPKLESKIGPAHRKSWSDHVRLRHPEGRKYKSIPASAMEFGQLAVPPPAQSSKEAQLPRAKELPDQTRRHKRDATGPESSRNGISLRGKLDEGCSHPLGGSRRSSHWHSKSGIGQIRSNATRVSSNFERVSAN